MCTIVEDIQENPQSLYLYLYIYIYSILMRMYKHFLFA